MISMNYNLSEYIIRAYISDGETFINGKNDFETGKVIAVKTVDADKRIISAIADGEKGKQYRVKVSFDKDGSIINSVCTCCKDKCRHVSSVLFKIAHFSGMVENNSDADINTDIFKSLSDDLKNNDFLLNGLKAKKNVSIYPVVNITDNDRLTAEFFIGEKTYYPIKNIFEFIKKIKSGGGYNVNKNIVFKISELKKDAFDYIDFIERRISETYDFVKSEDLFAENSIIMSKQGVDDFFNIAEDKKIICGFYNGEILFSKEEIKFNAYLRKDGDSFCLYRDDKKFRFIDGLYFGYIFSDGILFKADKKKFEVMKKVRDAFFMTENNEIIFSEKNMTDFINYIAPVFERNDILQNIDDIYNILGISEPEAEFYVDYDGKELFLEIKYISDFFCYGGILKSRIETAVYNMGFEYEFDENYRMIDENSIFDFYNENVNTLKTFGKVFISEGFGKGRIKTYKNVLGRVGISSGFLEIDYDFKDFDLNELTEILKAYKIKKRFFRMKNGSFIDIAKSSLQPMLDIAEGFNLSKKELEGKNKLLMPAYNALYLSEIIFKGNYKIKTNSAFNDIVNRFKMPKQCFEIPEGFSKVLRDYQKKGFFWIKALSSLNFGGILADDMGLGKTIQIISVISSETEKRHSIIICPSSLVYNWEDEIKKFAPSMERRIVAGVPEKRQEIISEKNFFGVFITSYDLLKRDIEYYTGFNFKFIIADEAQYIKNSYTNSAKAVKILKGDVRFALSGTPVENSLMEMWSIFDFIMPGYLGERKKFKSDYENPIVKYNDTDVLDRLKKKTAPFILRRIKKDVLKELPEKSEKILYCDMTPEQRKLYTANLYKAKMEIEQFISDGIFENKQFKILSILTRLRQLCCHPSLFIENYNGGSGKLETVLETIKNISENGHRTLLFSQFTSMLNIIKGELIKRKIDFFYLDGGTPSAKRTEMAKRFNAGEKEVFLISLKAGGTGLNLTGADVVIHFDPWWNPAVMKQASDRAYRIGQIKNVQVFYLVAKDSIEEKIMVLQEKKKALIKSVILDGGEMAIEKMMKDDIIEIFRT